MAAFLEGGLNFAQIPAVIESVMTTTSGGEIRDLDDVLAADAEARARASSLHPAACRARLGALECNSAGTPSGSSSPSACWSRCTSSAISGWRASSASRCCGSRWASASRCSRRWAGRRITPNMSSPRCRSAATCACSMSAMARSPPADLPRAFASRPPWQRILVLLAGPARQHPVRHPGAVGHVLGQRHRARSKPVVDKVTSGLAGRHRRAAQRRRDPRHQWHSRILDQGRCVASRLLDAVSDDGEARHRRCAARTAANVAVTLTIPDPEQRHKLTEPKELYRGLGFDFWL